jgi:hypothetical protein
MNVLNLPIKKQWFDMIESREKPEEYREMKEHWLRRFGWSLVYYIKGDRVLYPKFTHILFRNGYSAKSPEMLIELKGITIGKGNPKWGAPDKDVFILHLGEIVERKNLKK